MLTELLCFVLFCFSLFYIGTTFGAAGQSSGTWRLAGQQLRVLGMVGKGSLGSSSGSHTKSFYLLALGTILLESYSVDYDGPL